MHSASDFPPVSLEPSDNGPYRKHTITNTLLLLPLSRRFLVFRGILDLIWLQGLSIHTVNNSFQKKHFKNPTSVGISYAGAGGPKLELELQLLIHPALLERDRPEVEDRPWRFSGKQVCQLLGGELLLEKIALGELNSRMRERRPRRLAGSSAHPPVQAHLCCHRPMLLNRLPPCCDCRRACRTGQAQRDRPTAGLRLRPR